MHLAHKILIPQESFKALKASAMAIRKQFLKMHFEAQSGHIGTGLSVIDLLTYLYKSGLKPEDHFILSKGHGASALYATLNHTGLLTNEDLATYYKDGTLLSAHPAARAFKEIPAATGSLGHGLPIATGMAFSSKYYLKDESKTFCLLSDGECNEGSVWEAALFSAHHQLTNLTVIVDVNGLQGFGKTEEVINMDPFSKKWESFGFNVIETDGHDFGQIDAAFKMESDRPKCILAYTIKGKGVTFMEDKMEWHYLPMTLDQYQQAFQQLVAIEKLEAL